MKGIFLLIICLPFVAKGQFISTYTGTGIAGYNGDGNAATLSKIGYVNSIGVDALGNVYIADGNNGRIRKVDAGTSVMSTVAGNGSHGFNGDGGAATLAELNIPSTADIVVDDTGNIYISDAFNFRIRKVTKSTGIINTIAGTGVHCKTGDGGNALLASFGSVNQLALDTIGNIYVNDSGCWIRKISTSGIITTIAGTGNCGYSGDGGAATMANIVCGGIVCDMTGNVYFADPQNFRIRKINTTTGIISTIGGNGSLLQVDNVPALESGITPAYLSFNNYGELLISEQGNPNHKIRKIDASGIIRTVAGVGTNGFSGDGGLAVSAQFYSPAGIAVDTWGNIFIADKNNKRIRKITYPTASENATTANKICLNIYPNPASTAIKITTIEAINAIYISNCLGQVVYEQQYTGKEKVEVEVRHLPPGMYMVRVNGVYVRRFLKE